MQLEWLLPTYESKVTNDEVVHHNAKYHCFISEEDKRNNISVIGTSLCGRHRQELEYYEQIESGQVLQFPYVACKKCFGKWKSQFNIGC